MARMPKYEKIRNQRLHEKPVEEPKSRIATIINSAFFLWLMSALLFTLGGSYFTNHQACMHEADSTIEKWLKNTHELSNARFDLLARSAQATSMKDVREISSHRKNTYPEFKEETLRTLTDKNYALQRNFERLSPPMQLSDIDLPAKDVVRFYSLWTGDVDDGFTDEDLPALKNFSRRMLERAVELNEKDQNTDLRANCTIPNIYRAALGEKIKSVIAE